MARQERSKLWFPANQNRGVALGAQAALIFVVLSAGRVFANDANTAQRDPVQGAKTWIRLLKEGDVEKLAAITRLPFVQRGFGDCASKKTASVAELAIVLSCIARVEP